MRSTFSFKHGTSRLARILALAALLCAVGIPVLEAGHLHGLADSGTECLLYKSPALLPMVAAALALALLLASQAAPSAYRAVPLSPLFQPRQTRGPPARS
ncbi:hypothetical protein [Parahaliea mediterranea]|uniref:Uncharacterized protein n=1 Tax=Parahaliea mediterranea TaxID=651086 RepID=A0A939ILZ3_9GAMM|nr:hypothetical protein [Parahaliea mediterranea]MBN7797010.1 hypothetical protein [Parahaliea mediterranea]